MCGVFASNYRRAHALEAHWPAQPNAADRAESLSARCVPAEGRITQSARRYFGTARSMASVHCRTRANAPLWAQSMETQCMCRRHSPVRCASIQKGRSEVVWHDACRGTWHGAASGGGPADAPKDSAPSNSKPPCTDHACAFTQPCTCPLGRTSTGRIGCSGGGAQCSLDDSDEESECRQAGVSGRTASSHCRRTSVACKFSIVFTARARFQRCVL